MSWTVTKAAKAGHYMLRDQDGDGRPYREDGKIVTWVSDLAARQAAAVLNAANRTSP